MLQVAHLSARYKDKPALEDINLTIKPGEFMVILGPSGCGKTTLLNLIAGFITDYTGDISLNGKRVTAPGVERGVVFQDEGLLPWRTVLDNVAFGLQLAGINRSTRTKRAHELLVQVGLTDKAASFIWQLSGGQRQRVGIARALAAAPQLLLLDEPFGALDAFTREQMQTLLLQLWHDNRSQVLLITHDIEEALFLATELVLLSPGPGRVMEKIALNYGRRFLKGETCRHIKSAPEFIAQREYILHQLYAQREVQQ